MKAVFALTALALIGGTAIAQPRDARGIPVQSEEATPPPGVNEVPAIPPGATVTFDQEARFTTQPSTMNYPPCTRGQTDRCVQNYERPARRPR